MVQILNQQGNLISTSRNLRGIIAFSNRNVVTEVSIFRYPNGEGELCVQWQHGFFCFTRFASFTVLEEWVRNRRNFQGVQLVNFASKQTYIIDRSDNRKPTA